MQTQALAIPMRNGYILCSLEEPVESQVDGAGVRISMTLAQKGFKLWLRSIQSFTTALLTLVNAGKILFRTPSLARHNDH